MTIKTITLSTSEAKVAISQALQEKGIHVYSDGITIESPLPTAPVTPIVDSIAKAYKDSVDYTPLNYNVNFLAIDGETGHFLRQLPISSKDGGNCVLSSLRVLLQTSRSNKISLIKEVRNLTGLCLKDAKDFVEDSLN
jgi:hypothetical protein